jgi:hypothetical protein
MDKFATGVVPAIIMAVVLIIASIFIVNITDKYKNKKQECFV